MTNALEIVILGLSHRTAPLDVRERLAVSPDDLSERLRQLRELPGVAETALLSTCNRVEIYAAVSDRATAFSSLQGHLRTQVAPIAGDRDAHHLIEPHLYRRHGRAAIHHLFRVAASLDSMVVGEPQILGQVKDAFKNGTEAGTTGPTLDSCFARAFRVARRIRRETGIGTQTVSVSSVAVDLVRRVFAGFTGRKVLVVGVGEMSTLAARAMAGEGATIVIANRTRARAEALAQEHGYGVADFGELDAALIEADVVITSTGARQPILDRARLQRVQRVRRFSPIVIVDIAVPRDVEPAASEIEGVFLWDIDDLQKETALHLEGRMREAEQAETVIEEEVVRFLGSVRGQAVGPTIKALRDRFSELGRAHAGRARMRAGITDPKIAVEFERMADALINELLHAPQVALKKAAAVDDGDALAGAVQRLFDLPAQGEPSETDEDEEDDDDDPEVKKTP